MKIWHLVDEKMGHIQQVRGLLDALMQHGVSVQVVELSVAHLHWSDYLQYVRHGNIRDWFEVDFMPDLIVGCGHATHIPLILLKAKIPLVRTLLLMSPSLPLFLFDLVMMPEHDHRRPNKRSFVYQGVFNNLTDLGRHKQDHHLILLGGPSKRHQWSNLMIDHQLTQLLVHYPHIQFDLTSSRRTPKTAWQLPMLEQAESRIKCHWVEQTTTVWLREQMQLAKVVWVTEDSLSMIYEAMSAGCQVGLLALPRFREDRITAAVDELVQQDQVVWLSQVLAGRPLSWPTVRREVDRAVQWLMSQLSISATVS